jgi:MFS family permease
MTSARSPSRRIIGLLTLGVVAHGMIQTILFAVLPAIGREISLTELQVGSIISSSAVVFFFASRIWGRISDRLGRKPVLLIGLSGSALGCFGLALLFELGLSGAWLGGGLYAALVAVRMTQALIMSATHPSATAYVADVTSPAARTAGMGKIGAGFSIGSILGPAVAGLLAGVSLLLPVYFGIGTLVLCIALIGYLLPPSPALDRHQVAARLSYFDQRLRPFLLLGLLVFLGFSVIQQTLAFRLQDSLGLDARSTARYYGLMMMVSAMLSLFAQLVIVQRLTVAPLWLLRVGLPLSMLALLLLLVARENAWLIASSMALLGLSMGLSGPGFSAAISLAVTPREQGGAAGIASSLPGLSFVIGPVAGTGLYQLHADLPYLVTALAMVPGIVVLLRLRATSH